MSDSIRKFNYHGDTQFLSGKVVAEREENGRYLVDLELSMVSQRDVETAYATATALSLPRVPRDCRRCRPYPSSSNARRRPCSPATTSSPPRSDSGDDECHNRPRSHALPSTACIIDADTHLTEPHDLWTVRAPKGYEDRVPQVRDVDGVPSWTMDGRVLSRPEPRESSGPTA